MGKKYCALLLPVALLWASCATPLYFPDRANSPMLAAGGDAKLTLSVKPQNSADDGEAHLGSFAADLAVAPVNHLGLFLSYRGINDRAVVHGNDAVTVFNGHRWEGGAGYFSAFDRLGRMELYAGFGQGTWERDAFHQGFPSHLSTRYNTYFLQPALGVGNHIFNAGGGFRVRVQQFTDYRSTTDPDLRYYLLSDDGRPVDLVGSTMGFIEPFLQGEVGYRFVRFNLQAGFTAQVSGPIIVESGTPFLTLGLSFYFSKSFLPGR